MKNLLPRLGAFALGAAFALAIAQSAQADVITVTTELDSYSPVDTVCSLREAVTAANTDAPFAGCPAGSGYDVVFLPPGTYSLTIPGNLELNNETGDLNITSTMNIAGSGPDVTIVTGADAFDDRLIRVESLGLVRIVNLSLTNGGVSFAPLARAPSADFNDAWGGAVLAVTSTLTMRECKVYDNFGAVGGGVATVATDLFMRECELFANFATIGGGLASFASTVEVTGSEIYKNSVNGIALGWAGGAGIANGLGVMRVVNSSVYDNIAVEDIRQGRAPAKANAEFPGLGGGIFNDLGELSVVNTLVYSNVADDGGGIWNGDSELEFLFDSPLTAARKAARSANRASLVPPSIPSATVESSQVFMNSAIDTILLTITTNSPNAQFGVYGFGGGIANQSGSMTVIDSDVYRNTSNFGHGIASGLAVISTTFELTDTTTITDVISFLSSMVTLTVESSRIYENFVEASDKTTDTTSVSLAFGGGIGVVLGNASVSSSEVYSNLSYNGVGIANIVGLLSVKDSKIYSNDVDGENVEYLGCSPFVHATGDLRNMMPRAARINVPNYDISIFNGGGIWNAIGGTTIADSEIYENSNILGGGILNGVGIYLVPFANGPEALPDLGGLLSTSLFNTKVYSNYTCVGGGIFNGIGTVNVNTSDIYGNFAEVMGGGIANIFIVPTTFDLLNTNRAFTEPEKLESFVAMNIADSNIYDNATYGGGGGIVAQGDVKVDRSNIYLNDVIGFCAAKSSGAQRSGVRSPECLSSQASPRSTDTIFDTGGGVAVTPYFYIPVTTEVTIKNSAVFSNFAPYGGGMSIEGGDVHLENVTVSGNESYYSGGIDGLGYEGQLTLQNVTLASNIVLHPLKARNAPRISLEASNLYWGSPNLYSAKDVTPTLLLTNTIIANGIDAPDCEVYGALAVSNGFNLDSGTSCTFMTDPDDMTDTDPMLGPLNYNAPGNTPTHALLVPSPAIDTGLNTGAPATDQRGVSRPQDGGGPYILARPQSLDVDRGAYEYMQTPTAINLAGFNAQPISAAKCARERGRAANADCVALNWETLSESGVLGFRLMRAQSANGQPAARIGAVEVTSAVIAAKDPNGASYTFRDTNTASGMTYTYWLVEVGVNGSRSDIASATVTVGGGLTGAVR